MARTTNEFKNLQRGLKKRKKLAARRSTAFANAALASIILAKVFRILVHRIFILSPANSGGERARLLHNPRARFDLAHRLQRGESCALAEIFSFLSGLYFRGKYAYSLAFGRPPEGLEQGYVITSSAGLLPLGEPTALKQLLRFGSVPIDPKEPRYHRPLRRDAKKLAAAAGSECEIVLLGSIGTKKYAELLMEIFGARLLFPSSFVGRGDMSRGGLLLRSVSEGRELEYVPVHNSVRHGKRPEKLPPRAWGYKLDEGTLVETNAA
jgi:hypothetical protein